MALIDELSIRARAGAGGDGVVRWLHLKGKEYSGPAGGNGGDGGDVYVRAVRDVNLLARYRGEKKFEAEDGASGESFNRAGRHGEDLVIDIPVGSIVTNESTGERFELLEEGQTQLVLKGGRGGAGNAAFKSSVNRTPTESLPGMKGEEATLLIELRLIADAGLVGLPNAGKTSLLNALTGAGGKVASYAFTTLDPNLGILYGAIIADIPGLIEGAAAGKGLGFKFLRHIARTRLLLHCVSLESHDPVADYRAVRRELEQFEGGALSHKEEIVVLTKSDAREKQYIKEVREAFEALGRRVEVVSILDDNEMKEFRNSLAGILRGTAPLV
jgi:GTP-binding protein